MVNDTKLNMEIAEKTPVARPKITTARKRETKEASKKGKPPKTVLKVAKETNKRVIASTGRK